MEQLLLYGCEVGDASRAGAYKVIVELVNKAYVPCRGDHEYGVVHVVYKGLFRTARKPVYIPVGELEVLHDHARGLLKKRETGLYGAAPEQGEFFHLLQPRGPGEKTMRRDGQTFSLVSFSPLGECGGDASSVYSILTHIKPKNKNFFAPREFFCLLVKNIGFPWC